MEKSNAEQYIRDLLDKSKKLPVDENTQYNIELPPWYDEKKFKRAQTFYWAYIFAMLIAKLAGLLAILAVHTILDVLVCTRNSASPKTAYKRYLQTIFHTINWYRYDLKPGTKSWKSIEAVRKIHYVSSSHAQNKSMGMISHKDMAVTQFGFIGFVLLKPHQLGIKPTEEECDALVHFWRVIGYMLGLKDEYNLCTDSWTTTKPRLELMLSEVLTPALYNTTPEFYRMSDALVKGLWCFNPFLDTDAFLYFMKRLANVPSYHYTASEIEKSDEKKQSISKLSWYSRLILWLLVLAYETLYPITLMRLYLNSQMRLSEYIITYFPFLGFFKFGIKDSYVRILKEH